MSTQPIHFGKNGLPVKIITAILITAVAVWTVWPWLPTGNSKRPRTIVIYGFSILEPAITKGIFPAFKKKWLAQTGHDVELIASFAGSGTVTNQLIMGVPAELALLSTELDAERLTQAGTIKTATWKKLPHGGVINRTPFVILVRPGNPKKIYGFADMTKPGIQIVHPDPLTSGGANWAIVAEYGAAVRRPGAAPDDGKSMLLGIWRNVVAQASSARAAKTQFDNGFGEVLITYEQDAILSRSLGSVNFEIVYPRSTILSEHTLVVMDHNISRRNRDLVQAFIDFLWSEEAQRIFVEYGFRSVDEKITAAGKQFGHIEDPFYISDFGGWRLAKRNIIDELWKNEVLKEIKP